MWKYCQNIHLIFIIKTKSDNFYLLDVSYVFLLPWVTFLIKQLKQVFIQTNDLESKMKFNKIFSKKINYKFELHQKKQVVEIQPHFNQNVNKYSYIRFCLEEQCITWCFNVWQKLHKNTFQKLFELM